jgi:hypothetical protein
MNTCLVATFPPIRRLKKYELHLTAKRQRPYLLRPIAPGIVRYNPPAVDLYFVSASAKTALGWSPWM